MLLAPTSAEREGQEDDDAFLNHSEVKLSVGSVDCGIKFCSCF